MTELDVVHTTVSRRDPLTEFHLAVDAWLLSLRSANTAATYGIYITQWADWALDNGVDPLRPRRVDADRWTAHLRTQPTARTGKPLGTSSVNGRLAAAGSLLDHLIEEGVPLDNPFKRVNRHKVNIDHQKTPALADDEAARLLAAAEHDGPRSKVIIAVALTLGVRVSELAGIDVGHFTTDAGRRLVTVLGKGDKERTLVVPSPVWQDVEALLDGRTEGPLLTTQSGARMDRHAVRKTILRLAATAGVENAERIGPHALRRTTATMDLERGATPHVVQQKLGHVNLATTMLYLRARNILRDMDALNTATAATVYSRILEA